MASTLSEVNNSDEDSSEHSSEHSSENSSHSESVEFPPKKRAQLDLSNIWNRQCFESKRREIKFEHVWVINNITYHCMEANQNHVLYSSVFSSPKDDSLKMSLKLSLYDLNEKKTKYLVNLRINNCDRSELILKYSICSINYDGSISKAFSSKQKISKNNGKTFDCSELRFTEVGYPRCPNDTPGDVLTIFCEICYDDDDDDNLVDYNKIALTQLKNDFAQLIQSEIEPHEVELVFGRGQNQLKVLAHKAILSARSEVFAVMFDHDMQEKNNNRVELTDVDAEAGKVLLDYLYEKIPDLNKYADELLPISDKYQLHSLKSICEGALCFEINPESVVRLLLLADMHNAALLKSKCIEYIHCYSSCVVETNNMKHLIQNRSELCYELFKHIPEDSLSSWTPPTLTGDPNLHSWSYTSSRVFKGSQRWSIDKFKANYLSVDECELNFIESPLFPSDKLDYNDPVQFFVRLYPRGQNIAENVSKDHVSLYLFLKYDKKSKVAFKQMSCIVANENIENGNIDKENKKCHHYIISRDSNKGWHQFISHQKLMENSKLLGKNDRLVILCEVSYIENIDKLETKSGLNTFAQEHEFSIARDLSKFYESKILTDAVFVLGSKELKVHKTIVSARSEVFARLFANTNRVQIDDVSDVDAFERILALLYGQTEGLTQWALKMLPLLDKFRLNSLKQVCQLVLCDQLDEKNVVEYLILADKHKTRLLKSKAIEYIRSKHSVLRQNDALRVVQQDNPNLFGEVMCYKLVNWNK